MTWVPEMPKLVNYDVPLRFYHRLMPVGFWGLKNEASKIILFYVRYKLCGAKFAKKRN